MLTQKYKDAMLFAADLHEGQRRKATPVVYLSHLLSVSALVMENGGDETEAIAALLHDAIEDQGKGYKSRFMPQKATGREALKADIAFKFGPKVLEIVERCTDDEYLPRGQVARKGTPEEWEQRKTAYLEQLRESRHLGALRVSCADKLHNARAILTDYEVHGEALWSRFTAKSVDKQLWYYDCLAYTFRNHASRFGDGGLERMARELTRVVERIRQHSQVEPSEDRNGSI